jgi:hypothetical protein
VVGAQRHHPKAIEHASWAADLAPRLRVIGSSQLKRDAYFDPGRTEAGRRARGRRNTKGWLITAQLREPRPGEELVVTGLAGEDAFIVAFYKLLRSLPSRPRWS